MFCRRKKEFKFFDINFLGINRETKLTWVQPLQGKHLPGKNRFILIIMILLRYLQYFNPLTLVSDIFHYFWKNNVVLGYFERNTSKRHLTYNFFIFPLFHEHLFSPELPRAARLLKTSCFEKITVYMIETMLLTLPLVQINKAREPTKQAQIKIKSRQFLKLT